MSEPEDYWEKRARRAESALSRLRYDTASLIVGAKELLEQGRVAEGGMLWISREELMRLAANHPTAA